MNSRERVFRAFGKIKGKPDRVSIQFDLCRDLSDHFGKEYNIPVNYTDNLYEDVTYRISANELRIAMDSDVVITGASVSDDFKIEKIKNEHADYFPNLIVKRNYAKTLLILSVRILTKVTSATLIQYINLKNGKPINKLKYALAS